MKYKIGDSVWHARCEWLPVSKPCPICFTKRQVTLILGDGSQVILPCDYCKQGYLPPSGFVKEYEYVSSPQLITIEKINIEIESNVEKVTYQQGCYIYYYGETIFDTQEDALIKCDELKSKLEADQKEKTKICNHNSNKSYSWNAGYHLREAKENRKQAEYHEQMAVLCKEKAKQ